MDKYNNYSHKNPDRNIFNLLRKFFAFVEKYPDIIELNHIALYVWIVWKDNTLFWEPVFGLPTGEAIRTIGMKDPRYFRRTLYELEEWGFIKIVAKSKNQHHANQIILLIRDDEDVIEMEQKVSDFNRIREEMRFQDQGFPRSDPVNNETYEEEAQNSTGIVINENEDDGETPMEPMTTYDEEDKDLDWSKNHEPVNGDD